MSEPQYIAIETINTCNARCPFCPLFQGNSMMSRDARPAQVMEQELFAKIVAEIEALGWRPQAIFLNMNGEPLQDPLLKQRLQVIKEAGLGPLMDLQTNGQFLDPAAAELLLDTGINRLTIGFDAATRSVYETHRVRCNYDRVLANIRHFAQLRDERNSLVKIAIQYVRTMKNQHEVAQAYTLFGEFLDPIRDIFQDNFSKDWGDKAGEEDYFVRPKSSEGILASGCRLFEQQLIIHSDGTVAACCWDYNLSVSSGGMGDVAKDGLASVWNGQRRQALSQMLHSRDLNRLPEKCRTCIFIREPVAASLADAKVAADVVADCSEFGLVYSFVRAS
jgi:radical SAM protein with 4Fe4S-binding SPASM domain